MVWESFVVSFCQNFRENSSNQTDLSKMQIHDNISLALISNYTQAHKKRGHPQARQPLANLLFLFLLKSIRNT
jgi:hypothetical protein